MGILSNIKVPVTEEQEAAVLRLEAEDFGPVANRVKKDFGYSDERIAEGIEALKQYYVAAILDSRNRHAISTDVDPFWHTHVMFSKEYMQFGVDIFGKYMHHEPLDHDDTERLDLVTQVYEYTRGVYDQLFHKWNKKLTPPVDTQRLCVCCVMGSNVSKDDPMYDQGLFELQPFMASV